MLQRDLRGEIYAPYGLDAIELIWPIFPIFKKLITHMKSTLSYNNTCTILSVKEIDLYIGAPQDLLCLFQQTDW